MTTATNTDLINAARNLANAKGGALVDQAARRLCEAICCYRFVPARRKHELRYLRPDGRAVKSASDAVAAWLAHVA